MIKMLTKKTKKNLLKYSKKDFEWFWKVFVMDVLNQIKQKPKWVRWIIGTPDYIKDDKIKKIAHRFFDEGRIQMLCTKNLDIIEKKQGADK